MARPIGTCSSVYLDSTGVRELESGGCPTETILAGLRNFSDPARLASVVLRRWANGYDGSPRENQLRVEVWNPDSLTVGSYRLAAVARA